MNNSVSQNAPKAGLTSRKRRGIVGFFFGLVVLFVLALFVVPFVLLAAGVWTFAHPFFWFFPFGFFAFFFLIFFAARFLFWGFGWRRGYGGWGRGYWGHQGYQGWGNDDDDAVDILRQRYAKGEITKDQFDQMMKDLKAHDA